MSSRRLLIVLLPVAVWIITPPVSGGQAAKSTGLGMWNINVMVEQACKQIISRYKLNDQQAAFTRQLMARRVGELLDKHEAGVRQLFREAAAMRISGKTPSVEAIRSWAQRAMPIYLEAKRHIFEGNQEWAKILTPEQKKTHQEDLRMMNEDFGAYEERLVRWSEGGFDPKRDWIRRSSARRARRPVRAKPKSAGKPENVVAKRAPKVVAKKPAPGPPRLGASPGNVPTAGKGGPATIELDPEHFWDVYVRNFIRQYRLDDGQSGQAQAILKDCKERARRHRDAHNEDYQLIRKRLRELRASGATEAVTQVNQELTDLDAPISDLFEELKQRLESIPTSAQLQRYEASRQRREGARR